VYNAMSDLRSFLYDNVYRSHQVHKEFVKARKLLSELFTYFLENKKRLESELLIMELPINNTNIKTERVVCDFIASLTDRYALKLYEDIFFPSPLV
jgi:dGTPase